MTDDPFKEANKVAKESFYEIFAAPLSPTVFKTAFDDSYFDDAQEERLP